MEKHLGLNSYLVTCRLEEALEAGMAPRGLGSESLWGRDRLYYPHSSLLPAFPKLWIEA